MLYTDGREAAEGAHVSSVVKIEGFQSVWVWKKQQKVTDLLFSRFKMEGSFILEVF